MGLAVSRKVPHCAKNDPPSPPRSALGCRIIIGGIATQDMGPVNVNSWWTHLVGEHLQSSFVYHCMSATCNPAEARNCILKTARLGFG